MRWSTEARRKSREKGMVKRRMRTGRRRLGEQMMEVESWLKEEQDIEYSSEEATQLEDNMRMLDVGGTSEGKTAEVEVENMFKGMSIDQRRAKRWGKGGA